VAKRQVFVAATRNAHKLLEIRKILRGTGVVVKPLTLFPSLPEVVEDGKTLEQNAEKKAVAVSRALDLPTLSDDSGLFVPALNGKPGVKSARYAGPRCDYAANNRKLLNAMRCLQGRHRRAYFGTVVALARPGKATIFKVGKIWGTIVEEPKGAGGFGYDPIFRPVGETRTFAEMKPAEKNRISHRALAFNKLADYLKRNKLEK